ncbi:MAG: NfeD family protein [Microthrixaceae bacterium]
MGATEFAVIFLVVGLGLCAAEIAAPGLVLLPFGVGALIASLTGFVGAAPIVQALVFVGASVAAFVAMRPLARRLNESDEDEGIGARRLVGSRAVVLEAIPANDSGMVRIDREQWRAEAIDEAAVPAGSTVTVTDVRGTRVIVSVETPQGLEPPTSPPMAG